MSFFDSEIVQQELKDIAEMQEYIYENVFRYYELSSEEKRDHVQKLLRLIEKQEILYARLRLSDDPKAFEMVQNIRESAIAMGFPVDTDLMKMFAGMKKMIQKMIEALESSL